mmetsp:Transcript_65312/g.129260  ORF Transcript_65312/g.129260 Transcript_65312/m.129260 type:complete len:287 (-) Transcript_65312:12-872(-)
MANPKSHSLRAWCDVSVKSTLPGLMSRCATPCECRNCKAELICAVTIAASCSTIAICFLRSLPRCECSEPPPQRVSIACVPAALSYSASRLAMWACASSEIIRSTSSSRSCSSFCSPVQFANVFTATSVADSMCFARTIVEKAPAAIGPSTLKPNGRISFATFIFFAGAFSCASLSTAFFLTAASLEGALGGALGGALEDVLEGVPPRFASAFCGVPNLGFACGGISLGVTAAPESPVGESVRALGDAFGVTFGVPRCAFGEALREGGSFSTRSSCAKKSSTAAMH